MTLVEQFKEELKTKTVTEAFNTVNTVAINKSTTDKTFNIKEAYDFILYLKDKFSQDCLDILNKEEEEPFVFFLYDIILSAKIDADLLDEINNEFDKRTLYEMKTLKDNIKDIFNKYGILNIGKIGFKKIEEETKEIKNDIYIQNEQQLDSILTNNFFRVAFLLDYCFVNVITFDEEEEKSVMVSYHIYDNHWKTVTIDAMQDALDNIPLEEQHKDIIIEEFKRKY